MPIKTLGGMFCEPKSTCTRNFVKENVNSVCHLQCLIKGPGTMRRSATSNDLTKMERNSRRPVAPRKRRSSHNVQANKHSNIVKDIKINDNIVKPDTSTSKQSSQTFSERSVQTLETNSERLGSVKTPDSVNSIEEGIQVLHVNANASDKEETSDSSMGITKIGGNKSSSNNISIKKPDTTQKRSDNCENFNANCPRGYRLIPESERLDTLANLKKKYYNKIQELNSLPFTKDTLRVQQKRTEIEKDLKKIDAGVQMFDRSRVFVKDC